MRTRGSRRLLSAVVAAVTSTLVVTTMDLPASAAAPVDPPTGEENLVDAGTFTVNGLDYEASSVTVIPQGPLTVGELKIEVNDSAITPHCMQPQTYPEGSVDAILQAEYCVGQGYRTSWTGPGMLQFVTDVPRIDVLSAPSNGFFQPDIQWLEDEAVDVLMVKHGILDEQVVRAYYGGDIRAHIIARLAGIVNLKLYGEPMTAEETDAYDKLANFLEQRELSQARNLVAEYELWAADSCAYRAPAPPDPSLPVVPNPYPEGGKCDRYQSINFFSLWEFTDDTPPLETFATWARYRHPTPLMRNLSNPAYNEASIATSYGLANVYGWTAAAVSGVVAGALVSASPKLAEAIALKIAPYTREFFAKKGATAGKIVGAAARGVGMVRAGIIAAFTALVSIGLGIWQILEEQKIVNSIYAQLQDAQRDSDPLGAAANAARYAGLDYATLEQPASPPTPVLPQFRDDFTALLTTVVEEWTMFDGAGRFVPDANAGYDAVPPVTADPAFRSDTGTTTDTVQFASDDETSSGQQVTGGRVHFSRGNLMLDPQVEGFYQGAQPTSSVRFLRPDGTPAIMEVLYLDLDGAAGRQPPARRFQITELGEDRAAPFVSETWELRTLGGATATYRVLDRYRLYEDVQVVPTLAGVLLPGQPIKLQAHVSDDAPQGLEYSWRIDRLSEQGTVLETRTRVGPVAFGTEFDRPGSYRASVAIRKDGQLPDPLSEGLIDFTVRKPTPIVTKAELVDDRLAHDGQLFLDLEFEQLSPSDDLTVEIEWADDLHGNKVVRTYDVHCRSLDPEPACVTDSLRSPASAPTNPNWSASPVFRVPDDAAFLPLVTMTVTNSYGASEARTFRIDGEHRARYDDRTPYVKMEVGTYSRVAVTQVTPSPLLDQASIGITPFVQEIADQLPAGLTPDIDGPDADGKYTIYVRGEPQSADIGPTTFSYPVDQLQREGGVDISVPESRPAPATVVLDIVASDTPGFRGIISGVPTGTDLVVARTGFPKWGVQVAYSRADGAAVADDPVFPGPVVCDLHLDGRQVAGYPQLCERNRPFPWPAEARDGRYDASVTAVPDRPVPDVPVDSEPYEKGFLALILRPTLTREPATPTADTDTIRLAVEDFSADPITGRVSTPYSAAGYGVRCRLDSRTDPFAPCLDDGALAVPRTPGRHRLWVRVKAPDGSSVVRTIAWKVARGPVELSVTAPTGPQLVGTVLPVEVTGLAPGEAYSVRMSGEVLSRGTADDDGLVETEITVPGVADGIRSLLVVGEDPDRTAFTRLVVVDAKTLDVSGESAVPAGGRIHLTVSGLVAREQVTFSYRGTPVRTRAADARGVVTISLLVGTGTGPAEVTATGAYASRVGRWAFTVTS